MSFKNNSMHLQIEEMNLHITRMRAASDCGKKYNPLIFNGGNSLTNEQRRTHKLNEFAAITNRFLNAINDLHSMNFRGIHDYDGNNHNFLQEILEDANAVLTSNCPKRKISLDSKVNALGSAMNDHKIWNDMINTLFLVKNLIGYSIGAGLVAGGSMSAGLAVLEIGATLVTGVAMTSAPFMIALLGVGVAAIGVLLFKMAFNSFIKNINFAAREQMNDIDSFVQAVNGGQYDEVFDNVKETSAVNANDYARDDLNQSSSLYPNPFANN